jgi:hypothetical protein
MADVDWTDLAQDRNMWQAIENVVTFALIKCGEFLG